MVKSLGATHTMDRHLPASTLHDSVKSITSKPIHVVFDTVGIAQLQAAAQQIVAAEKHGGVVVTTLPVSIPQDQRDSGKKFVNTFGSVHVDANRQLGKHLFSCLTGWLERGVIKVRCLIRDIFSE